MGIDYYTVQNLSTVLLETWKRGQQELDKFWKIWTDEYLKSLREIQTMNMKPIKGEINRIPKIGEVVIIKEDDLPRGTWKMARIVGLIESEVDKMHRAVNLVTSSGRKIKRPFRLIYPMEGSNIEEDDSKCGTIESGRTTTEIEEENNKPDNSKLLGKDERTNRIAATIAKEKIRKMIQ